MSWYFCLEILTCESDDDVANLWQSCDAHGVRRGLCHPSAICRAYDLAFVAPSVCRDDDLALVASFSCREMTRSPLFLGN